MNLIDAEKTLSAYLNADIPAFLWGAPGSGKSDLVRSLANNRSWSIIDFRAILRDPVDLRGLPAIQGDSARWLPPSDLPNAKRDGERGILFLDELNAAPAMMQAACFGLVLDRKVGEYSLPDGWKIIAAGNRQSDRAAAQRMPSALANRFAHIDVEPDIQSWTIWAEQNQIDKMVLDFVRFRPSLLHDMSDKNLRTFPTPRAWSNVSKICNVSDELRYDLVSGLVGVGAASEFEGFVRTFKNLPSINAVLSDPDTAMVPSQLDAKTCMAFALARYVTDEDALVAAMTYMRRLDAEFERVFFLDVCRLNPAMRETKTGVAFAIRHQGVMLN